MHAIKCKNCQQDLTHFLKKTWKGKNDHGEMGKDFVSVGSFFKNVHGDLIINIADKFHLYEINNPQLFKGCCGPSPEGPPNLTCTCGIPIGRITTDCCSPHYIQLNGQLLVIEEDKWDIFGLFEILRKAGSSPKIIQQAQALLSYHPESAFYILEQELQAIFKEKAASYIVALKKKLNFY